jgi:hypothetical protein
MEIIEFKTAADWTVQEWDSCLVSVSNIYSVFLAMGIVNEYERNVTNSFSSGRLTIVKVLEKLHDYADDSTKLRIHKVNMASPGDFSFKGSCEIIKETRKFISEFFGLFGKTTKMTDAEIGINNATAIRIEAEAVKLMAEAKKNEAEATKLLAEADEIKIQNEGRKSIIIGDKLKMMINVIKSLDDNPCFRERYNQDNGEYNREKKILSERLFEGLNGLLTLEMNGRLIDIYKNIGLKDE